ncbi:hypothetical protein OU994_01465 [Pseudoduganella sp. SL102]|uniref:hypothetical protein n=1 Tax=Pseudoduganella sp. SL102 TaxID=2995154 RepID=UPI00248B5820|nr:hypothetical protein [Pseudoduganella sp. SL102]WBS03003.1 hypothetical protein OU994_01465 [Pseudoduganella sp. SL102]
MRLILQPMEQATLRVRGTVRVRCLGGTLWITGCDGIDRLLEQDEAAELRAMQATHLSSVRRTRQVDFELEVALPSSRLRRAVAAIAGLAGQLRQFL